MIFVAPQSKASAAEKKAKAAGRDADAKVPAARVALVQSLKEGGQVEEMQRLVDDANAKLEQQKSVARSAAGLHAFPESCCDSLRSVLQRKSQSLKQRFEN